MAFDPTKVDAARELDRQNRGLNRGLPAGTFSKPAGEFKKGLRAGSRQLVSIGEGVAGVGNVLVGRDEAAKVNQQNAEQLLRDSAAVGPRVKQIQDVKNIADFADFTAGTFGQVLPVLAPMVLAGAGGAALAGRTGAIAGAVAGSTGTETGIIFPELQATESDLSPRQKALTSIGFGALAGSLDVIAPVHAFTRLGVGKAGKRAIEKSLLKDISKGAGQSAVLEGTTEGIQSVIERAAVKFANENEHIFGEEGVADIINSVAAGFLVGAGFGTVGAGAGRLLSTDNIPGVDKGKDVLSGALGKIDQLLADVEANEELSATGVRNTVANIRSRFTDRGNPERAQEIANAFSSVQNEDIDTQTKFARDLVSDELAFEVAEQQGINLDDVPNGDRRAISAYIGKELKWGGDIKTRAERVLGPNAKKILDRAQKTYAIETEKMVADFVREDDSAFFQQEDELESFVEFGGTKFDTKDKPRATEEIIDENASGVIEDVDVITAENEVFANEGFTVREDEDPTFIHQQTRNKIDFNRVEDSFTDKTARAKLREIAGLDEKTAIAIEQEFSAEDGFIYSIVPAREAALQRNKIAGGVIVDTETLTNDNFVIKKQPALTESLSEPKVTLTDQDLEVADISNIGVSAVDRNKVLRRFNDPTKIAQPEAHLEFPNSGHAGNIFINIPSLTKTMIAKAGNIDVSNSQIAEAFRNAVVSLVVDRGVPAKLVSKMLTDETIVFQRNDEQITFGELKPLYKSVLDLSADKEIWLQQFIENASADFVDQSVPEGQIIPDQPVIETEEDLNKIRSEEPVSRIRPKFKNKIAGRTFRLFREVTNALKIKNAVMLTRSEAFEWAKENDPAVLRGLKSGRLQGFNNGRLIYVNPALSEKDQLAVLTHELGHVVFNDYLNVLEKTNKKAFNAIHAEYEKWVRSQSIDKKAVDVLKSRGSVIFNVDPDQTLADLTTEEVEYVLDFEEWFADQLTIYLQNPDIKPVSANDKLIQRIALRIKELLAEVLALIKTPTNKETNRFFNTIMMGRHNNAYNILVDRSVRTVLEVGAQKIHVQFLNEVNPDGRLATTKADGSIVIRKNITKQEVLDYIQGKDKTHTSIQKKLVNAFMQEQFGIDLVAELQAMSRNDIIKFIAAHEQAHVNQIRKQGDKFDYFGSDIRTHSNRLGVKNKKNKFLTDQAVELEADANVEALNSVKSGKKTKFSRTVGSAQVRNILLTQTMQNSPYSNEAMAHVRNFFARNLTVAERNALNNALSRRVTRNIVEDAMGLFNLPVDMYHAAAFQMWIDGTLHIGPQTENTFTKVLNKLRDILQLPSYETQAQEIFSAVAGGRITDTTRSYDLRPRFFKSRKAATANAVNDLFTKHITPAAKLFGFTADSRMQNNPVFRELAALFHARLGEEGVKTTYFEERDQLSGQFNSQFERIMRPLSQEDVEIVFAAAQAGYDISNLNTKQRLAVAQINATFQELNEYLIEAGVLNKKNPGFFPRAYDFDLLRADPDAFLKMLRQPKYKKKLQQYVHAINKSRENAIPISETDMPQQVLDWIMRHDGMIEINPLQDLDLLAMENEAIEVTASFQNLRKLGWIEDGDIAPFLSKDFNFTVSSYIDRAVKTGAFNRRIKPGDLTAIQEQAVALGATEQEIEQVYDYVNAMIGRLGIKTNRTIHSIFNKTPPKNEVINPKIQKVMSSIIVARNFMILGLASITSLADPLGILVRTGDMNLTWKAFKVGGGEIRQAIKNMTSKEKQVTEANKLAQTLGIIDIYTTQEALEWQYGGTHLSGGMKKVNEGFFKFIGLTQLTRMTRTMATTAGIGFIEKHAVYIDPSVVSTVSVPSAQLGRQQTESKRFLKQLGIEPTDIKLDDKGSLIFLSRKEIHELRDTDPAEVARDARIRNAVNRFVNEAILRPNAAQRPMWASDPHYMLVFHLQSFMYSFHSQILRRVYTEYADHKNVVPALMLMSFPLMMLALNDLRDKIKFMGNDNPRKGDWTLTDHMVEAVDRSGIAGVAGTMIMAAKTDIDYGGFGVESRLGVLGAPTKNILRGRPLISNVESFLPLQSVWKNWNA